VPHTTLVRKHTALRGFVNCSRILCRRGRKTSKHEPKGSFGTLSRRQLSVREIRYDSFWLESLAQAMHIRPKEVIQWIEQAWFQATVTRQGKRNCYPITPQALARSTNTICTICSNAEFQTTRSLRRMSGIEMTLSIDSGRVAYLQKNGILTLRERKV